MVNSFPFVIGNVVLTKFEVPEKFDIGHELMTAEHKLITEIGKPVVKVHTQGAFPLPTVWQGLLVNNGALRRAATLDALCTAQQPVDWVYGPLKYRVIIKRFKATPHHQYEVEYEIEVIVLESLNGAVYSADAVVPFDIGTQQFYGAAQASYQAMLAADPSLSQALSASVTNVDSLLTQFFPLSVQPIANILLILTGLDGAIFQISSYVKPLLATAILEADLAKLNASLAALNNYTLLRANLAQLAGSGPYMQSVRSFIGNLFDLASRYYPNMDPTDVAPNIASANGLLDFFVLTPTDIQLPPVFS